MIQNPVLEELGKTREELLAAAGGTLAGLVQGYSVFQTVPDTNPKR